MANRSTFPEQIDSFVEHYDIQASDVAYVRRFQELKFKNTLTPNEQSELSNLTTLLRDKIFTPEDFNKLQDAITNLETFFRDNVQGYVSEKQIEMNNHVSEKVSEINSVVQSGKQQIEASKSDAISEMTSRKNYFESYVDTKETQIETMVRDFDSNSARYVQTWVASSGQLEFDIYAVGASNQTIPPEANLNISVESIDLIVNGTTLTPRVDYTIKNDGLYRTIVIDSANAGLIGSGTEVVAKWYKNVGKLYFSHANSHRAGGSDPLTVYEDMLETSVQGKINRVPTKISIDATEPSSPAYKEIWIDIN